MVRERKEEMGDREEGLLMTESPVDHFDRPSSTNMTPSLIRSKELYTPDRHLENTQ